MSSGRRRAVRVAIDGPAGAGKSTVARRLAERLGYLLLDTGALYRTVALAAVRAPIRWDDREALGALAEDLVARKRMVIERAEGATGGGSGMRVLLDGEDVSTAIRSPDVSLGASRVSAVPAVRAALLDMQRGQGAEGGVVLEGRDIGTVVFPDAEVKFFLTASPEVRARRRYEELVAQGKDATYEATFADVERRDKADTERPVAPLRQADDAIVVDSSHRDVAELVEEMALVVEQRERAG
ncbi:(d)CMP kinase [Polyangium jinanense]|uniref:Cytidylate kinase n=1 Tax=Polyangium jinanense TaxID=2829994 RepID=A0A9X4ASH2_9BACT|nr:(d)CMP kinase [Polyangium jinanense]MDC3955043.1 (d)CMP kinase [Polyangium jinanense]MDC3981187.1 (d)CMP kinase [Polyangium jinanense]